LQGKQAGGMVAVFEIVGGGLVNGYGSRPRGGVGRLSGVQLPGIETKIAGVLPLFDMAVFSLSIKWFAPEESGVVNKKPLPKGGVQDCICMTLSSSRSCSAGIGTWVFTWLPRLHRAGPSASLDKSVT
jgi:hypothetical protein